MDQEENNARCASLRVDDVPFTRCARGRSRRSGRNVGSLEVAVQEPLELPTFVNETLQVGFDLVREPPAVRLRRPLEVLLVPGSSLEAHAVQRAAVRTRSQNTFIFCAQMPHAKRTLSLSIRGHAGQRTGIRRDPKIDP